MTTPSHVAGTAYAASAAATSHAVPLPSGIVDGSTLLGIFTARHTTTAATTWPAGWTVLVDDAPNANATAFVAVAYKRVTAGDPEIGGGTATVDVAESSRASAVIFRLAGDHASTGPQASTPTTGSNANPDPANLAPAEGGSEDRLWFAVAAVPTTTGSTTAPAGYTDDANVTSGSTSGTRITLHVAHKAATAASEDAGTFTAAGSAQWVATSIAIRPVDEAPVFPAPAETVQATTTVPAAAITGSVDRTADIVWDGSEAGRLSKRVFSAVSGDNVSALEEIDTARNVVVFHAASGPDPATSGSQRDAWLVTDTDGLGVRHMRVPFWGSPVMGSTEIGNVLPQHGAMMRYTESGGRRRAVIVWQNIFFGVTWSLLAGVWAGDNDGSGSNFVNRQVGRQMDALGYTATVTSSVRVGGVVTLTLSDSAVGRFAPGSYIAVDVATASFDGPHLVTGVAGNTVTYSQAGADEAGGAGTAGNVLPYDVEARLPGGSIIEVRAKRSADQSSWPAWATYDTDAGVTLPGTAGNYVSMPDHASFDMSGTVTLITDVTAVTWVPGLHQSLLSKFGTSNPSGQRSYRSRLLNSGRIDFGWSTNGTTGQLMSTTTALPAQGANTRRAVAVEFIPDDGAGNRRLRVYTASTHKGTWVLHEEVVTAGATSLFQGTAPLELGSVNSGALEAFQGRFHYAAVIDGLLSGGNVRAEFIPNNAIDGSTTWTDPTSNLAWTMNGTTSIENTGMPASEARAFAVDLDLAGAWATRVADPTPTSDTGPAAFVAAHLGTDDRSKVTFGPSMFSTSLADFPVDATVTPATIAAPVAFPAAAATVGVSRSPDVIAAPVSFPAAAVSAGATVTPAVISVPVEVQVGSPLGAAGAAPAAITSVVALPAATTATGATVTPEPVAATAAVPAAGVATGYTVTPGPILAVAAMDTPTWGLGVDVTPAPIAAAATFPTASFTSGAAVTPGPFTVAVAFPAATVDIGAAPPSTPAAGGITADQLADVRDWVGSTPGDDVIEATWARKGTVAATALAILRARRADLLANPTKWSVDGDYSQEHTAEALKAINAQIDLLEDRDDTDPTTGSDTSVSVSYLERCGAGR